jgi:phosphoglycolate phosphatase
MIGQFIQQALDRESCRSFALLAAVSVVIYMKKTPPGGTTVIKTCIFDMDGTLTDTFEDIANAGNYALSILGFPVHPIENYKAFIGNGVTNLMTLAMPEQARTRQNVDAMLRLALKHYDEHLTACTRPFEGVPELLKTLANNDIALCIVTNKADHQAKLLAKAFFPEITFLAIMGEREGSTEKPDPTDALACARLSGAAPQECAFIGDSDGDIHTGRNADMLTIAVDWGYRTREFLEAAGPDYIASTPKELSEFLLKGRYGCENAAD